MLWSEILTLKIIALTIIILHVSLFGDWGKLHIFLFIKYVLKKKTCICNIHISYDIYDLYTFWIKIFHTLLAWSFFHVWELSIQMASLLCVTNIYLVWPSTWNWVQLWCHLCPWHPDGLTSPVSLETRTKTEFENHDFHAGIELVVIKTLLQWLV